MDWNKTWEKLKKELGRDPTVAEVTARMLSDAFNGEQK
jgi:hypothetical protein